ncbi:MAG: SNF2 family DNA or RNA helicase [Pirellulaceae bacterium]|jgi:SNF2 family DNA or RNA helicase
MTDNSQSLFESDLQISVSTFATGWQTAIARPPKIRLNAISLQSTKPHVISLRVGRRPLQTTGFVFPEGEAFLQGVEQPEVIRKTKPASVGAAKARTSQTRMKPPGDIIKLRDRLYYVLQPPLESLMASQCLEFPFEPFPYQFEGIAFLYPRYSAVLADEMGLGKTMQAISAIRMLLAAGEVRNILLICPKPLVTNWVREFTLWAPEVAVGVIEGDAAKRQWQWEQSAIPVKIANYELLMRDRDIVCDSGLHFDIVVLDEAQRIKNKSSTTSQVVKSLSRSRSWALTGTPVENSSEDLVGIFEFLSPGYLDSNMRPRQMGQLAGDYILRRTKDMVLTDMPPKLYRDAEIDLTPEQYSTYKIAEDEGVMRLAGMGEDITIQHVFELVLRLKQICNFDPVSGASSKQERLVADMEEVAASGQKAIVFSQWVKTIEKISGGLDRFGALQYHGKIPSKKRDAVLDQFKNDPTKHVLLMSYGAGSVGLNLQFSRYVFLFDRWWNPAVEDQAINRAHRIGVTGSVTVTRMLAVGTVEERINQVLEEKRELFNMIFSEAAAPQKSGLTQDQIFGLFNLRTPKGPIAA